MGNDLKSNGASCRHFTAPDGTIEDFFTNYLFLLPKRLPVPESYWPYHQNYVVKGLVCQSALFREYLQWTALCCLHTHWWLSVCTSLQQWLNELYSWRKGFNTLLAKLTNSWTTNLSTVVCKFSHFVIFTVPCSLANISFVCETSLVGFLKKLARLKPTW